jgi:hypothetical protein
VAFLKQAVTDLDPQLPVTIQPLDEEVARLTERPRFVAAVMLAQENDQWIVTLITHFQNLAPAAIDGFIEFTRTLAAPFVYDVIRNAEPLGEAVTARFPASIWRRYDKLKRFPAGYLVFGATLIRGEPADFLGRYRRSSMRL